MVPGSRQLTLWEAADRSRAAQPVIRGTGVGTAADCAQLTTSALTLGEVADPTLGKSARDSQMLWPLTSRATFLISYRRRLAGNCFDAMADSSSGRLPSSRASLRLPKRRCSS